VAQDYRSRLLIPENGDERMRLFTRHGTLIAEGYLRVVIGDRGPYLEFHHEQLWRCHMRVPAAEYYRHFDTHVFYAEYRSNDVSDVKVYWQRKPVDYADYKIGLWYISLFDLVNEEGGDLIRPVKKEAPRDGRVQVQLI
jgi:hypothetical protein